MQSKSFILSAVFASQVIGAIVRREDHATCKSDKAIEIKKTADAKDILACETIVGDIKINAEADIDIKLAAKTFKGKVEIIGTNALKVEFTALEAAEKDFVISKAAKLAKFEAKLLKEVKGALNVNGNDELTDATFPALTTVGSLNIQENKALVNFKADKLAENEVDVKIKSKKLKGLDLGKLKYKKGSVVEAPVKCDDYKNKVDGFNMNTCNKLNGNFGLSASYSAVSLMAATVLGLLIL